MRRRSICARGSTTTVMRAPISRPRVSGGTGAPWVCSSPRCASRRSERRPPAFAASRRPIVQMPARQRQRSAHCGALRGEDLIDVDFTGFEVERAARHVEPPNAVGRLADMLKRFLVPALERGSPMAQRQCIVGPQGLDVRNFKSCALHETLNVPDGIELTVRKYISIDELRRHRLVPSLDIVRNAVIEKQAAGLQNPMDRRKINR